MNRYLDFVQKAFGATVNDRMEGPGGTVMHADVSIGNSHLMIGEPRTADEQMTACLYLYTEDCDAMYKQALAAGAESLREPQDEFYGDRSAGVRDKWGNSWWIGTHIEDVSPEEMQKRMQDWMKEQQG